MRILLLVLICFLFNQKGFCYNLEFFKRFNDNFLDCYIEKALNNNHELKQANYKLEQFQGNVRTQLAHELPQASVSANYLGAHFPNNDADFFLLKQNSFVLPLRASYEPDFLLKNRDKTKSAQKLYRAQIANCDGVYISLLSNVASTYINILLADYLIEKQLEIISSKALNLGFNNRKFAAGIIDAIELSDYIRDLDSEKMIYENLVKNQKTNLYNFSLLLGESAENIDEIKRAKLEDFEYCENIPEIINSDLIYSRPDVIEIENKLKSAKIDLRVAKKDFFPSFNITGFLIFDTAGKGNFFSWESSFALLLAGLTQDIFKGGEKIANLKIKKARYNELFEEYKQIDLNAIKEINNALNLIKQDTKTQAISNNQVNVEKSNVVVQNKKLNRGIIAKTDYLDSKVRLNQKQQIQALVKTMRLNDYLTLYKALGGQL